MLSLLAICHILADVEELGISAHVWTSVNLPSWAYAELCDTSIAVMSPQCDKFFVSMAPKDVL